MTSEASQWETWR